MIGSPLILYVPGLLPKPEAERHHEQLLRCLLASVQRIDDAVASEIAATSAAFDLVSWTFDFYGSHRDVRLDLPNIEAAISKEEPTVVPVSYKLSQRRADLRAGRDDVLRAIHDSDCSILDHRSREEYLGERVGLSSPQFQYQ